MNRFSKTLAIAGVCAVTLAFGLVGCETDDNGMHEGDNMRPMQNDGMNGNMNRPMNDDEM